MAADGLLLEHLHLFLDQDLPGPILDLAAGDCHNGIYLAFSLLPVICCDISRTALNSAQQDAEAQGATIETWHLDLEKQGIDPLPADFFGGIVVFRYLHRPLIPGIRKALKAGGILLYETFTRDQARFGKPRNPDYLLQPGELRGWFADWNIIHYFEGIKPHPVRAVAQIVCRKPA